MWDNFWKGGRTTSYEHSANFTYTLPTSKLPLIDWTTFRIGYIANYNWLTASLDTFAKSLGNFVGNTQEKNLTGELDFTRLYAKSRFLRAMDWDNAAKPPQQQNGQNKGTDTTGKRKNRREKAQRDPNQLPELSGVVKVVGRIITSVKRVSIQYSERGTTNLRVTWTVQKYWV